MKYKIFDVVELKNGNKATIIENKNKEMYKAEIINAKGESLGIDFINENEIRKTIFKKK